jgi:lactate dehydrogenase-like 2-hydroxyacid dehydrogenase
MVVVTGGEQTEGLVDRAVLQALGPQGYLVNVARGSVIDEPALVQALQDKTIAGAGLDVYVHEPSVPAELMSLDNAVLLPHVGSGTHETRRAMEDLVFDNVQSFFSTGRLITPVVA